eukprot:1392500-Amorphochlora_amoeboformis.AAC.1
MPTCSHYSDVIDNLGQGKHPGCGANVPSAADIGHYCRDFRCLGRGAKHSRSGDTGWNEGISPINVYSKGVGETGGTLYGSEDYWG